MRDTLRPGVERLAAELAAEAAAHEFDLDEAILAVAPEDEDAEEWESLAPGAMLREIQRDLVDELFDGRTGRA
jgi:hypothetical protein